jgi:hypothetical protein
VYGAVGIDATGVYLVVRSGAVARWRFLVGKKILLIL